MPRKAPTSVAAHGLLRRRACSDLPPVPLAPPPHLIPLDISGEGRAVRYAVYPRDADPDTDRPITGCVGGCRVWLPPGKYRIVARSPDGSENQERITLERATSVAFRLERPTGRALGLAGGIVGPLMILGGFAMSVCPDCSEEDRAEKRRESNLGGLLMLSGIVATTAGWIVFAQSGPDAEVTESDESYPRPHAVPTWSFVLVPTRGGSLFAGRVTF